MASNHGASITVSRPYCDDPGVAGFLARVIEDGEIAAGDPLWYTGDTSSLSPQIEAALQPFLDESHARAVAVLPSRRT